MLEEWVFSTCSWKIASSDDVGKEISQLHQELVNAYKKRFMCENGQVAVVKCSPIWKNMRKDFKTFPELKAQIHSQIEAWKQEAKSALASKGALLTLWKNCSRKDLWVSSAFSCAFLLGSGGVYLCWAWRNTRLVVNKRDKAWWWR